MPLETGTYISDLNASNPVGASDPKSQGDDHLRLIKSTLLATFPNVTGEMSLTHTNLNNALIKNVAGQAITAGNVPSTPTLELRTSRPVLVWDDSDAAVDEGRYYAHSSAGAWSLVAINDANDSSQAVMTVARTGINVDSVAFSVDDAINLEAIGGGTARIRSAASTDTENRRLLLSHQDGTQRAALGHEGADTLWLRNHIHAGHVYITAEDTLGATINLFQGDPDGATTLYESGNRAMLTHQSGIHIADTLADDPFIGFYDTNFATRQGFIQWTGATGIIIAGEVHGAGARIQAEDAGGTVRNMFLGDPDGAAGLYYAGSLGILTRNTFGGQTQAISGSDVRHYFADDAAADVGWIRFSGTTTELRSLQHGAPVQLMGEDAGGTNRTIFQGDPDGIAQMYYAGQSQIRTQENTDTGVTSSAEIRDHTDLFRDAGFNVLPIQSEDVSDTLEAKHCGGVYFKDGSVAVTLTLEANTSTDFPVSGVCTIINANDTADITVTEGTGTTLYQLDGSARVDTAGGCTVGPGGIATLWREATTVYYIFGQGITP